MASANTACLVPLGAPGVAWASIYYHIFIDDRVRARIADSSIPYLRKEESPKAPNDPELLRQSERTASPLDQRRPSMETPSLGCRDERLRFRVGVPSVARLAAGDLSRCEVLHCIGDHTDVQLGSSCFLEQHRIYM